MLKGRDLSIYLAIAVVVLCTCIDPYYQKIDKYESLLVVDGMITNENSSYKITLSKTVQSQNAAPEKVSDATVFITDDAGGTFNFANKGNGIYKSDSTLFSGEVGRLYVLHVSRGEGEIYESDPCLMHDVPDIDSLYFEKDQELFNNGTEVNKGIRISLDSKPGDENTYYRWGYEETWKFKVPDPVRAQYINSNTIIAVTSSKEYCWKASKSYDINIHAAFSGEPEPVRNQSLIFIASDKSDRLLIQYSILAKQYSISKAEFDFWDNLKRVGESGNDIFAAQPYTVESNIHNVNNPDDRILGYFQVSAVSRKRLDIPISDIAALDLPYYHYKCERVETNPTDPIWVMYDPPLTFDQLYSRYTAFGYTFIEPRYFPGTTDLDKIILVLNQECVDCELTGKSQKPDFWVDMN